VLKTTLKAEWPKMLSWVNVTAHLGDLCYAVRPPTGPTIAPASPAILDCGWGPPLTILVSLTVLSLLLVWRRLRSVEGEE
jgi:hypothetical protein